jgi:hypothetical protein
MTDQPVAVQQLPIKQTQVHTVTVTEKPFNLPNYKWEVDCVCGWQGRFGQEVNAKDAGNSHLGLWGAFVQGTEVPPSAEQQAAPVEEMKPKSKK